MPDKLIAMSTLIEWGKELRFQSEEQLKAVYERMPSIEIVRCKDCECFTEAKDVFGAKVTYCDLWDNYTLDTDFCSYAERGEDGRPD